MFLLDVNVLVALLNEEHVFHAEAREWFYQLDQPWLSCPITELGVLRVLLRTTDPPQSATVISNAVHRLKEIRPWLPAREELSPLDRSWFNHELIGGASQTTDVFLLGVAVSASAALATFDYRIKSLLPCVRGATKEHLVLI